MAPQIIGNFVDDHGELFFLLFQLVIVFFNCGYIEKEVSRVPLKEANHFCPKANIFATSQANGFTVDMQCPALFLV